MKAHGRLVLAEWMVQEDLTQTEVAQLLGVAQSTVCGWLHGVSVPHREAAKSLATVSNGAVPVTSWYEELTAQGERQLERLLVVLLRRSRERMWRARRKAAGA